MICKLCGTEYNAIECPLCALKPYEDSTITRIHFGRHKGATVEQIYTLFPDYLQWMLRQGAGTPAQRAKGRLLLAGIHSAEPSSKRVSATVGGEELRQVKSQIFDNKPKPEPARVHNLRSTATTPVQSIPSQKGSSKEKDYSWVWGLVFIVVVGGFVIANNMSKPINNSVPSKELNTPTLSKPTIMPTPTYIATPSISITSGYAVIAARTSVFETPSFFGKVLETTGNAGIVSWQRRTADGLWYERTGGGWIASSNIIHHYSSIEDALNELATPTPQPIYIPPATPTPSKSREQELSAAGQLTYPTDQCVIKGNVSYDTGEQIYHLPGQKYYDSTVIDPRYGERWFCTEEDAINNGWRKSEN